MVISNVDFGYNSQKVEIEVSINRDKSIEVPRFRIAGLADHVTKMNEYVVSSNVFKLVPELQDADITVRVCPVDLYKDSERYQLPILIAVLCEYLGIENNIYSVGSMTHQGMLREEHSYVEQHVDNVDYVVLPRGSDEVYDIKSFSVSTTFGVFDLLKSLNTEDSVDADIICAKENYKVFSGDGKTFDEINSNRMKRAMSIAIAGRHHMLAYGKDTALINKWLSTMPNILTRLSGYEVDIVDRIYRTAGLSTTRDLYERPFVAPIPEIHLEGLYGGGKNCRPGQASLAHRGILCLNETQEFKSSVLQMLKVPMETKQIVLSRAGRTTIYPMDFQLVMSVRKPLSAEKSDLYWKKLSAVSDMGVIIDCDKSDDDFKADSIDKIREDIEYAIKMQNQRQGKPNNELTAEQADRFIEMEDDAWDVLGKFCSENNISDKRELNIRKTARTIADMAHNNLVTANDIAEAISFGYIFNEIKE